MPETVTIPFSLGDKVRDKYTKFTGYVHAVGKYITGCDRVLVNPRKLDEKGVPVEGQWFDDLQLELVEPVNKPVVKRSTGGPAPREEAGLRRG